MGLNEEIQKELDRFAVEFVGDLQKSLANKGARYEQSKLYGTLDRSYKGNTFKDGTFTMKFTLPSYYYWVDKGRKPGNVKESGQKSIGEWANRTKSKNSSLSVLGDFIKESSANSFKDKKRKTR